MRALASAPPAASASVSTRGVICQETPHLSLHLPHALVGRDLEREGLVMLEHRTSVEAETRDAGDVAIAYPRGIGSQLPKFG